MQPRGMSYSVDVKGCNPVILGSKASIQEYIIKLCKTLELERIEDCIIHEYQLSADRTLTFVQLTQSGYLIGSCMPELEFACIDIFNAQQLCTSTMTHFTNAFFEAELGGYCQVQKRAEAPHDENDSTD